MLRDRRILESNFVEVLSGLKHKRKTIQQISDRLGSYGILPGTLHDLIQDKDRLSEIPSNLLCILCLALFEITGKEEVSPFVFYSERELEEAKKTVRSTLRTKIVLPYTIPNVLMLDSENFITVIDAKELRILDLSSLIVYDFESQREADFKKVGNGVVPVPKVNSSSVKQISERIMTGTYFPDTITLNVYSEEIVPFTYNSNSLEFTINEGATISILDGFHRLRAIVRAYAINPDFQLKFNLAIKSFDTETAKKYFGQINTVNRVNVNRLKELKGERSSDQVIRDLLRRSKELQGKVASGSKINALAGHITTFEILSDAVDSNFELTNIVQIRHTTAALAEFFSYLFAYYPQIYEAHNKIKHDTVINQPLAFAAFVRIARYMSKNNIDMNEVQTIISKFDFSASPLTDILDSRKARTKKTTEKLYAIVDDTLNEVLHVQ